MRAKIKHLMAVLLAVLFSYSFSEIFIPIHNKGIVYIIFVYFYLFALSLFVFRYLIKKSIGSIRGNSLSKKVRKMFLVIFISLFISFVFIPKNYFNGINYTDIILTPISEASELNGTEVWLNEIIIDESKLDLESIDISSGWIYKDGAIVSTGGNINPQKLIISFKKSIDLVFGKHAWSGKVEIYNGDTQIINLYSEISSEESVSLAESSRSNNNLIKLLAYSVCVSFLSMIFLILVSFLKKTILSNRNK